MQFLSIREFSKAHKAALSELANGDKKERDEAFERLMKFKREKAPPGFNYKKELMETIDERFGSVD